MCTINWPEVPASANRQKIYGEVTFWISRKFENWHIQRPKQAHKHYYVIDVLCQQNNAVNPSRWDTKKILLDYTLVGFLFEI